LLLVDRLEPDLTDVQAACKRVFAERNTHIWPNTVYSFPTEWTNPLSVLARESAYDTTDIAVLEKRFNDFLQRVDGVVVPQNHEKPVNVVPEVMILVGKPGSSVRVLPRRNSLAEYRVRILLEKLSVAYRTQRQCEGAKRLGEPLGITNIGAPALFGHSLASARAQYVLAVAIALAAAAFVVRLQGSHLRLAWRALREGYTALAYSVGASFAAVAGSLLVQQYGYVSPDMFGLDLSVLALTIVVLGGLGSAFGAIVGAAVLVGAPELFRPLHDYRVIAYGLLLLGLVRFRPAGVFGYR
jgi:hypothetical protein